ncbi:MAG: 30S ribosomal protein S8 [Polyangiaceae bacterium]|nr:30S ribosomal protein S8 [Polyangiaceae bacterium]
MMTDPISDLLARIRNASQGHHDRIELPHSRIKENIGYVLKSEGFVDDVRVSDGTGQKTLTIVLRYGKNRQSAIDGMRRVSSPGRRVYVGYDRIPRVCSGLGTSILSTSRGVMTDKEARKQKLGGELLCEVW